MKKITLYAIIPLLLSCKITTLNAQNVTIPDANFKAELISNSDINTNNDNEIQLSEAQAYTDELEIDGKNITDLTGIEAFISIEELDCSNNQLTNLDLTSNTNLEELKCSNNKLSALNISMNVTLEELDCANNQLISLDLSASTRIEDLNCSGNQLTSLDLTMNTNLEEFNCSNNQLTMLNIKNGNNTHISDFNAMGNPNLTCINVDNPAYSTANWTDIDANATFNANCVTSIHAITELNSMMSIFPNPASTHLDLTLEQGIIELVEVLDITGRTLQQHIINTNSYILDVNNLPSSSYFIKIRTTEGKFAVQPFLKVSMKL